ncbi:YdcF family protein [Legionella genomosp. 1]|uniref:YdcF family protein n=1 Tax=Legionella genomosp. 1 TaxID=1093625 RepID=UPI0021CB0746|nr:YdcF family protein [Legionella genomosp. 1]
MVIRHLIEAVANPFFLLILFFAFLLYKLGKSIESRRLFIGFSIFFILLLVISTGWLPQFLTQSLEKQYPPVKKINPEVKWIVVLSGGQTEIEGLPPQSLLYSASAKRVLEGLRLWRQSASINLLLSGGGYGQEKAEAFRMRKLALLYPVDTSRLQIETGSLNTADQAAAIKAWVSDKPFYLVTSAIHMPRAMALCKAQGLRPIAAPTDFTLYWGDERWQKTIIPNAQNMVFLNIALHELMGLAWGKFRGLL